VALPEPTTEDKERLATAKGIYDSALPIVPRDDPINSRPYEYLTSRRHLTEEEITRYGLRFKLEGDYRNRILIPFWMGGTFMGFTARSYTDEEPRYLSVSGVDVKRFVVYNINELLGTTDTVVIVEGALDAISISELPTFVGIAMLGKQVSLQQYMILSEYIEKTGRKEVILLPDPDVSLKEVLASIDHLKYALPTDVAITIARLPKGEDANSIGPKQLAFFLKRSVPQNKIFSLFF
jgi:DNA primase